MRDRRRYACALTLICLTAVLNACGGDTDDKVVPDELVGTWEAGLADAAAAIRIAIGADRSFLITLPGRERPFSVGPATVTDERLMVSPDEHGDCTKTGTYQYEVSDETLTLRPTDEPCADRREGLGRTWTALEAVPPSIAARRRALEAFRRNRNAICTKRSSEAAAINATAAQVGEPAALRLTARLMQRTQDELDDLDAPTRFTRFIDADRKSRITRIGLHTKLADAHAQGDFAAVGRIGRELVEGNVLPNERLHDRYFMTHCP